MIIIKSSLLDSVPNIKHGFFSRIGGYSSEPYNSLNCNLRSNDTQTIIHKNINLVAGAIGTADSSVKILKQVHSNRVILVDNPNDIFTSIEADALITKISNISIGVITADCVPILLCDSTQKLVASVHAGWKGAFTGIIENTVNKMRALGSKSIVAAIGPCIRDYSYEVDNNFYLDKLANNPKNAIFFSNSSKDSHYLFNLPGYCNSILKKLNVMVDDLEVDTYSNPQLFFSYRKSCHQAAPNKPIHFGGQLSLISLCI